MDQMVMRNYITLFRQFHFLYSFSILSSSISQTLDFPDGTSNFLFSLPLSIFISVLLLGFFDFLFLSFAWPHVPFSI